MGFKVKVLNESLPSLGFCPVHPQCPKLSSQGHQPLVLIQLSECQVSV